MSRRWGPVTVAWKLQSVPPAFIPDHSYEIKFNKNRFLCRQRNEIQPFLNEWAQWGRTAEETSCSTCISQVGRFVPAKSRKPRLPARFAGLCTGCGHAPPAGFGFVLPFQSGSPSALLSEIGNPFSWTRFLAPDRRDRTEDAPKGIRLGPGGDAFAGFQNNSECSRMFDANAKMFLIFDVFLFFLNQHFWLSTVDFLYIYFGKRFILLES